MFLIVLVLLFFTFIFSIFKKNCCPLYVLSGEDINYSAHYFFDLSIHHVFYVM